MEVNQGCVPGSTANSGQEKPPESASLLTALPGGKDDQEMDGAAEQEAGKVDPRTMFLKWQNPQADLSLTAVGSAGAI
jgi:hypothetical protein